MASQLHNTFYLCSSVQMYVYPIIKHVLCVVLDTPMKLPSPPNLREHKGHSQKEHEG